MLIGPKIWIPLCLIDYFITTVFKFVFVSHCASFLVSFLSFVFLLSCSSLMSVQAAKIQWSLREKVGSPAGLRVRRITGKGGRVCVCVCLHVFVFPAENGFSSPHNLVTINRMFFKSHALFFWPLSNHINQMI